MKARIRNITKIDSNRIFSAKICGGVRGYEDMNALEVFSNDIVPCLKTINEFTLICEPMNKRLNKMIESGKIDKAGLYVDCLNQSANQYSGTILTNVDSSNNNFVSVEPQHEVLNTTADGLAPTLTTAHHYSGNIVNPKRGQKEMGVLEIYNTIPLHEYGKVRTAVKQNFRLRKLTERECFRLMGVDDEDISKIQSADISKSQMYKLAGNSIVVDVLTEIFRKMFIDQDNESNQLTLF